MGAVYRLLRRRSFLIINLRSKIKPGDAVADDAQLGLARIQRETVQERVYGVLRDRLMRGGFEPGQKLKIADLSAALGTSAMPIRARFFSSAN